MTEISPPVLFLVLSAIAAGLWKAFTYFHAHFKEAGAARRELWPELKPFHDATRTVVSVSLGVLSGSLVDGPSKFQTQYDRWHAMYNDKRGRFGRGGRRRARKISGLLHDVYIALSDPPRAKHYEINERDLALKLFKVKLAIAGDADYFSR